jgi:hypothetical protein
MSSSHWPVPTDKITSLSDLDVSDEDLQKAIDPNMTYSIPSFGNVTINTSNTGYNGSWITSAGNTANSMWTTSPSQYTIAGSSNNNSSKVEIKGEDADLVINGKSLTKFMEAMESRLAILQPNLEKLEHFAALKKAYEHYKALEALCELPKKEDDNT